MKLGSEFAFPVELQLRPEWPGLKAVTLVPTILRPAVNLAVAPPLKVGDLYPSRGVVPDTSWLEAVWIELCCKPDLLIFEYSFMRLRLIGDLSTCTRYLNFHSKVVHDQICGLT